MKSLSEQARLKNVANILAKLKDGKSISAREQRLVDAASEDRELITKEDVSRRYGVTSQAITNWVRKGCPLTSWDDIEEWRKLKVDENSKTIQDAKLKKTLLEVEKLEIANSRARGDLIPRDAVRDRIITAGGILVAQLQAMANDMPGQLAGATESQVRDRLEARHGLVIDRFREALAKAWEDIGGE
jgi:hypothetical protein